MCSACHVVATAGTRAAVPGTEHGEEPVRLPPALGVLVLELAADGDATTRADGPAATVRADQAPNDDAEVGGPVGRHPPEGTRVGASGGRLDAVDQLHRPQL